MTNKPAESMIERGAKAMRATSAGQPFSWENAFRAAIMVIRDPTPNMLAKTLPVGAQADAEDDFELIERALAQIEPAAITEGDHFHGVQCAADLLRDWRTMIDTILNEGEKGGGG